jgi:small subunit ribosomal protein S4
MGDPKKPRKQFEKPRKVWDSERLQKDRKLKETYGLKNMHELWKAESFLRNKRQNAKKMLALPLKEREKREKELIESLSRIDLLNNNATLDDILGLKVEALLERRLETLALRKNLALTAKQARQFITHGKIAVNGRKTTIPGFIVPKSLENTIAYFKEPMKLELPKEQAKEEKKPKNLKKEFEEAAGIETPTEETEIQEEAKTEEGAE